MSLNAREFNAVCQAITQTVNGHVALPFGLIREQSLVSEIYSQLRSSAQLAQTTKLNLAATPRQSYKWPAKLMKVNRVQCEMEVGIATPGKPTKASIIDLVVFKKNPNVSLTVHQNGPGDIVQKISSTDVAAAIECKASPSKPNGQKKLYLKDLCDLYALASANGTDCFFVLLDKTQGLYGTPHQLTTAWTRDMAWRIPGLAPHMPCPLPPGVTIKPVRSVNARARSTKPSVWIFSIAGGGVGQYVLR